MAESLMARLKAHEDCDSKSLDRTCVEDLLREYRAAVEILLDAECDCCSECDPDLRRDVHSSRCVKLLAAAWLERNGAEH